MHGLELCMGSAAAVELSVSTSGSKEHCRPRFFQPCPHLLLRTASTNSCVSSSSSALLLARSQRARSPGSLMMPSLPAAARIGGTVVEASHAWAAGQVPLARCAAAERSHRSGRQGRRAPENGRFVAWQPGGAPLPTHPRSQLHTLMMRPPSGTKSLSASHTEAAQQWCGSH